MFKIKWGITNFVNLDILYLLYLVRSVLVKKIVEVLICFKYTYFIVFIS